MSKPKTPNSKNLHLFATTVAINLADPEADGGIREVPAATDCKKAGFKLPQVQKYFEMGLVKERAALVESKPAKTDGASDEELKELRDKVDAAEKRATEAEEKAETAEKRATDAEKLAAKAGADLKKAQDEIATLKPKPAE